VRRDLGTDRKEGPGTSGDALRFIGTFVGAIGGAWTSLFVIVGIAATADPGRWGGGFSNATFQMVLLVGVGSGLAVMWLGRHIFRRSDR